MDQFMLRDQMIVLAEERHPFGELGKHMSFLNRVVDRECLAQMQALGDEAPDRHTRWPAAGCAGLVQHVPGIPEMVVLEEVWR